VIPEWIAVEHYRLHLVENWPPSAHRDATLAAIHSSLASLDRNWRSAARQNCPTCMSEPPNVQVFPDGARVGPKRDDTPYTRVQRTRTPGTGTSGA
jgi:hypothetical protein